MHTHNAATYTIHMYIHTRRGSRVANTHSYTRRHTRAHTHAHACTRLYNRAVMMSADVMSLPY